MNIPIRRYLDLLSDYLRPQRLRVALLTLLLMGSIAVQLGNPQLVKSFLNTATSGGSNDRLLVIAAVFVLLALCGQALAVTATWLSETIGWTATNELRAKLFEHCLRLDMAFHKTRTPGEMIQRVDGDVDALSNFFSQLVVQVLANGVLLIGVVVLLFIEDWRIGLALGSFGLAALSLMLRLRSLGVRQWEAEREQAAQFYGFLGEHLSGTEDVRANGATSWVMARFYRMTRVWRSLRVRAGIASSGLWIGSAALFTVADAVAFAVSAWLWHKGQISIGGVYVIFYYTEMLRRPIEMIRQQMQELQTASASIIRVDDLLKTKSTIEDGPGAPVPAGALSLDFDRVAFQYEAEEQVLDGVSFSIEPGRVLGLLGRSGSGKTTIARLVFRLYDPDQGSIKLGGVALPAMKLDDLRQRAGMVTQEVEVFNASIRDNLTFFDGSVPDQRLIEVIDEIGLSRWFAAQPRGLDTVVTSGGLSAGEAQLLAFARLFLADPGLVILDEASSRLDAATERLIESAVSRLLKGRTAILIAHRLATIERADDVMILEDGHVVEYGPRLELLANPESRLSLLMQADAQGVLA